MFPGFNLHSSAVPVTAPNYKNTHASVTFDQTEFVIKGHQEISVNVYFDPPQENITDHMLYGGYIELLSNNSASSSRVPYFGSLGNQYDLPIFDVSVINDNLIIYLIDISNNNQLRTIITIIIATRNIDFTKYTYYFIVLE